MFIANTHDYILCFSNRGRIYWLKVYEVPQGGRASRGKPIVNLVPLMEHEKITAVLPVKEFDDEHFVFMATANGTVKKTALSDFSRPMSKGIIAVNLEDGDYLIGVSLTDGKQDVMLFSDAGKAVRFAESEVRAMGRAAGGVRGMRLATGQHVISLLTAADESLSVLTATQNGYGKRTRVGDYPVKGRGTMGVKTVQLVERKGRLAGARIVRDGYQVMLISDGGTVIRIPVDGIRRAGRSTQGVIVMRLREGEQVATLAPVIGSGDDVEVPLEGEPLDGDSPA